jgi:hypothetical protein
MKVAESMGSSVLLLEFTDGDGIKWSAAAICGPAVSANDKLEIQLRDTRGTGLRVTGFKVVEP